MILVIVVDDVSQVHNLPRLALVQAYRISLAFSRSQETCQSIPHPLSSSLHQFELPPIEQFGGLDGFDDPIRGGDFIAGEFFEFGGGEIGREDMGAMMGFEVPVGILTITNRDTGGYIRTSCLSDPVHRGPRRNELSDNSSAKPLF